MLLHKWGCRSPNYYGGAPIKHAPAVAMSLKGMPTTSLAPRRRYISLQRYSRRDGRRQEECGWWRAGQRRGMPAGRSRAIDRLTSPPFILAPSQLRSARSALPPTRPALQAGIPSTGIHHHTSPPTITTTHHYTPPHTTTTPTTTPRQLTLAARGQTGTPQPAPTHPCAAAADSRLCRPHAALAGCRPCRGCKWVEAGEEVWSG